MVARRGFTLIEVMIAIAIVALLAVTVMFAILPALKNARDVRRKAELYQVGKLLVGRCYVPEAGDGDYDLMTVANELKAKYPQYANAFSQIPRDPSKGTNTESFYRYNVQSAMKKCAVYGNLEDPNAHVTISPVSTSTPGGGVGIFQASGIGWNGTDRYYQFSN